LIRMRLNGSRTVVANGGWPFAWNPDGSSVAYLMGTEGAGLSDLYIDRGGQSRKVDSVPVPRGIGCESRTCADAWDVRMIYSPNGAYISLNYVPGVGVFRIWTADGRVLKSMDSSRATMSVWSGDSFYWRDEKGVERWRDGQQSLVLPGVSWIRPHASPAGGQIVYETRDAGIGKAHVYLLDTASGNTRELPPSLTHTSSRTRRSVPAPLGMDGHVLARRRPSKLARPISTTCKTTRKPSRSSRPSSTSGRTRRKSMTEACLAPKVRNRAIQRSFWRQKHVIRGRRHSDRNSWA
jgi:hypothetical protein